MIQVEHLKKTYVGKKHARSRGLVDVSFTLPATGFVFVLGKSGSGKSTLLNLLGALDDKTDGKILIEGKDLDSFTAEELDSYRSSYCGFIFQDYQLIPELTVEENVSLALDIVSDLEDKDARVRAILEKVDLLGFENRYPSELSGGQRQRVSIARALVKNPRLVLCDEPTGNLDKKTAKSILGLLKEVSKDCLVFMVSHDERACFEYAERKIVLEEGLVIRDVVRDKAYKNEFRVEEGKAYLPSSKDLKPHEIQELNDGLSKGEIREIAQAGDGFSPFRVPDDLKPNPDVSFSKHRFEKKEKRKLSKTYALQGKAGSGVVAFLFSLLTVATILVQTLLSFDRNKIFFDNLDAEEQEIALVVNADEDNEVFLRMKDGQREVIESHYEGKTYPVINFSPALCDTGNSDGVAAGKFVNRSRLVTPRGLYASFLYGTAIVDDDYLRCRYGNENGDVEVLAGSLDDCRDGAKLIVTDFFADCVFDIQYPESKGKSYDAILGPQHPYSFTYLKYWGTFCGRVGAVIKTDYKKKFPGLFEAYEKVREAGYPQNELLAIEKMPEYEEYLRALTSGSINLAYSLNPNFLEDLLEGFTEECTALPVEGTFFSVDPLPDQGDYYYSSGNYRLDSSLARGEIRLSAGNSAYQKVFGTFDYVGKKAYWIKTDGNQIDSSIVGSVPLEVVGTTPSTTSVGPEDFVAMATAIFHPYARLVPLTSNYEACLTAAMNDGLMALDGNRPVYQLVRKTVNLFGDIFRVLYYMLLTLLVAFFGFFSVKWVRERFHPIGIMKSLGASLADITGIFLSKNAVIGIASILLTAILSYPFLLLANSLIVNAYANFMGRNIVKIDIFYFHPDVFLFHFALIALTVLAFTFIPFLLVKRVSPAKIVNNKNE